MATLWLLRDGEETGAAAPAATGSLADLQKRYRLGDLAPLRVKQGSVSIGSAQSALQRRRHAVVLLDNHEGDMTPGYYAGRYSA